VTIALLASAGHGGVANPRTAPEPSDVALFVVAALALWFVRRALRKRFRRRDEP
jgi:hypothetical protein